MSRRATLMPLISPYRGSEDLGITNHRCQPPHLHRRDTKQLRNNLAVSKYHGNWYT